MENNNSCGLRSIDLCDWFALIFWASAGTAIAAFVSPAFWEFLKKIAWLNILTAIGTCGAVIVAVGLHQEKKKASQTEKMESARLYALEMRVRIQYFVNLSNRLRDLNFSRLSEPLTQERINSLLWLATQIIEFDEVLKIDFTRLSVLGQGIAPRLAVGISQVRQGALAVNGVLRIDGVIELTSEQLKSDAVGTHLWLDGGNSILKDGFNALSKVADEYFLGAVKISSKP